MQRSRGKHWALFILSSFWVVISPLHFILHDKESQAFLPGRNFKYHLVKSSYTSDKENEKEGLRNIPKTFKKYLKEGLGLDLISNSSF